MVTSNDRAAALSKTLLSISTSTDGYQRHLKEILVEMINPKGAPHPFNHFVYMKGGVEEVSTFDTFEQYLKKWSRYTLQNLKDLFNSDNAIGDLLDVACQREGGKRAKDTVDNIHGINDERPTGTSKSATLRRLRKDNPELHTKVIAGELSANAAAIEAGFRWRSISISERCVKAAAESIRKKFGPAFARELAHALTE